MQRILLLLLGVAVMNTGYLSWRYLALHAGLVEPGTGLCSWSEAVDCDVVLRTVEARALYVPNALLGLGFFAGCLVWALWTPRARASLQPPMRHLLALWLLVGSVTALWFFTLLMRLSALCPFCPWNHVVTWCATALALALSRRAPISLANTLRMLPALAAPTLLSVTPTVVLLAGWLFAMRSGALAP